VPKEGSPAEIQTPTHWKLIGHSMTAPPPVIAQHYSSYTFVSLRFHSRKEQFGAFKKSHCFIFYFFKIAEI
jgi:hypothetical protein